MPLDEHDYDDDGEHDEDECELCFERNNSVSSDCRCGNFREGLTIEVSLCDAEREPRIAAECGPLYDGPGETRQHIGYLLNDAANAYACRFFDRQARLCGIYATRPLCCRVFDCRDYEHRAPDASARA